MRFSASLEPVPRLRSGRTEIFGILGNHENQARTGVGTPRPDRYLVDNEAGILAKIAGLFTARGYNIDSLTVADITENHSRQAGSPSSPTARRQQIDQIRAQLERLVPVHKVVDLTEVGPLTSSVSWRLIKVAGVGDHRVEALRLSPTSSAPRWSIPPHPRASFSN